MSEAITLDAKWLLIGKLIKGEDGISSPKDSDHIHRRAEIFALDGSRTISFSTEESTSTIVWLSDSMHWAEVTKDRVSIHSLVKPSEIIHVPIDHQIDSNSQDDPFNREDDHVVTQNDHLISNLENAYDNSLTEFNLYDADLHSNPIKVTTTVLKIPADVHTELVEISPDGKWIAWKWFAYHIKNNNPWISWLQKYFPSIRNAPSIPSTEVWISRIDGSDMKMVGYMAESFQGAPPYSLSWSFDSKRLYFNAGGDTMWTIPAGN